MKFLVLALCVCAASAASFGNYNAGAYKPFGYSPVAPAKAAAQAFVQVASPVVEPVVPVAKAIVAPVVPVAVTPVPVRAAPVPVAINTKSYNTESDAVIIRDDSEVRPDGYSYAYETNNGIVAESTGALKRVGDSEALIIQGGYRYVAPDGTPVVFSYVADENGYQPQSDLLPVAPPVPEAIARSLAYIASHPQPVEIVKQF